MLVFNNMIDVKTLDRYASIMVNGITTESFPLIVSEVYLTVSKTKGLDRSTFRKQCIELLNYIIDNTTGRPDDESLCAIAKQLIPGMVDAFMMIEHPLKSKKWFSCF